MRGQPKHGHLILGGGDCVITRQNRTTCSMCCLEVGMKPDKVDAMLAKRREKYASLTIFLDRHTHRRNAALYIYIYMATDYQNM